MKVAHCVYLTGLVTEGDLIHVYVLFLIYYVSLTWSLRFMLCFLPHTLMSGYPPPALTLFTCPLFAKSHSHPAAAYIYPPMPHTVQQIVFLQTLCTRLYDLLPFFIDYALGLHLCFVISENCIAPCLCGTYVVCLHWGSCPQDLFGSLSTTEL